MMSVSDNGGYTTVYRGDSYIASIEKYDDDRSIVFDKEGRIRSDRITYSDGYTYDYGGWDTPFFDKEVKPAGSSILDKFFGLSDSQGDFDSTTNSMDGVMTHFSCDDSSSTDFGGPYYSESSNYSSDYNDDFSYYDDFY